MFRAVLVLAISAVAFGNEIYLKGGQYEVIKFAATKPEAKKYQFRTSPNSNIKVYCGEFRLPMRGTDDTACDLSQVIFDDGVRPIKKCSYERKLMLSSARNILNINFDLKYGGFLQCVVRTTEETTPTEVYLSPEEEGFVFDTLSSDESHLYLDKSWKFTTQPNAKLSYQCSISYQTAEPCFEDILAIEDGEETKEFCGGVDLSGISKASSLSIRILFNKKGSASTHCLIQSVTGPNLDQVKNLESVEVDSTEYGVKAGRDRTSCQCGWVNKVKPAKRIINGKETTEGEYPWMAGIKQKGSGIHCGGSIITRFHVLTAAHCVPNDRDMSKISPHSVVVGIYNLNEDASHGQTQTIDIKQYFIPNDWLTKKKRYDISVLLLEKEIVFSKYVGPVCLPQPNKPYQLLYKRVKITGWGRIENYRFSPKLRTTRLWVLGKLTCPSAQGIVCTYSKSSSICYGDSGGPYVYLDPDTNRYAQISVNSYTNHESCIASSGSANVSYHMEFILDSIKKSMPQQICHKV